MQPNVEEIEAVFSELFNGDHNTREYVDTFRPIGMAIGKVALVAGFVNQASDIILKQTVATQVDKAVANSLIHAIWLGYQAGFNAAANSRLEDLVFTK